MLVKHQLRILNRRRKRAPNLRAVDRIIAGLCALFMRPARVLRSAIVLKPSTLLHLHNVLRRRKYRMLFSPKRGRRPGPNGPKKELIDAVVEMKRRDPNWGCPRIAYRAIRGQRLAKYLSSDHDPLYRFHQWQANLRVLEVTEIKTVPYVPLSHPFVERLIGTVRREYLDRTLFWTTADLETKLFDFQHYYNGHRTHAGLEGGLPEPRVDGFTSPRDFHSYGWRRHCRGLYQTPIAA